MTTGTILEKYEHEMHGKVRDTTLNIYMYSLRHFFTSANGSGLSEDTAQKYIDSLVIAELSPSTVNLRAQSIMSFFRWRNTPIELDCPSIIQKKPEYLKMPEINKLISTCRSQLERTLVVMLFDTAVRISELINLTMNNINWDLKTITVIRKGGRESEVNVSDKAMVELRKWVNSRQYKSDKVFDGLAPYDAWLVLKALGKRANIPHVHPHIFRHSRAIQMLQAGVEPYVVQQHLGHKSITTTMNIYGMFMAADLRKELPAW